VFKVLADGGLERVGIVPTGGNWPRNFCVDPDSRFVICANERSDTLVVQKIDQQTGLPAPVGEPVSVTKPMFVMAVDF
jgi:6-phosphogluconolactonase